MYGTDSRPATLVVHSSDGRSSLSLIDPPRVNALLANCTRARYAAIHCRAIGDFETTSLDGFGAMAIGAYGKAP